MVTKLGPTIGQIIEHFGTQEEVARIAGVSQPAVSQWLNEESRPGSRSLHRIQKASRGKFKAREIRPELF